MRLFVDCDDTLMISVEGRWQPNARLIREIERWVEANPDTRIIVWSGASEQYAHQVGQQLLPHISHEAHRKEPGLAVAADLAIDDVATLPVLCPVRDPLHWVASDG